MELCLLNFFILVDCLLFNSYPYVLFESLPHVINQESHYLFICEIWGKFTSFIFWNYENSLVSLGRFQNFKKVKSGNLTQISLLDMWLLVQIIS